jgi:hypothetical protein
VTGDTRDATTDDKSLGICAVRLDFIPIQTWHHGINRDPELVEEAVEAVARP